MGSRVGPTLGRLGVVSLAGRRARESLEELTGGRIPEAKPRGIRVQRKAKIAKRREEERAWFDGHVAPASVAPAARRAKVTDAALAG